MNNVILTCFISLNIHQRSNTRKAVFVVDQGDQMVEFSPIGRLFTFGSFLTRSGPIYLVKLCINFDKNGLGYVLAILFTHSSGHPGSGVAP
jgi:hypothetical protein